MGKTNNTGGYPKELQVRVGEGALRVLG